MTKKNGGCTYVAQFLSRCFLRATPEEVGCVISERDVRICPICLYRKAGKPEVSSLDVSLNHTTLSLSRMDNHRSHYKYYIELCGNISPQAVLVMLMSPCPTGSETIKCSLTILTARIDSVRNFIISCFRSLGPILEFLEFAGSGEHGQLNNAKINRWRSFRI